MLKPDYDWLRILDEIDYDTPHSDLIQPFTSNRLYGKTIQREVIGSVDVISGAVTACGPDEVSDDPGFFRNIPNGTYPVEASIIVPSDDVEPPRITSVRVVFNDGDVFETKIAARGDENIEYSPDTLLRHLSQGILGIFDPEVGSELYENIRTRMAPDDDDLWSVLSEEFEASHDASPDFQMENGSWMEWTSPVNGGKAMLIRSELTREVLPYWGLDVNGCVLQLIVPILDIEEYALSETEPEKTMVYTDREQYEDEVKNILKIPSILRTTETKLRLFDSYFELGNYSEAEAALESVSRKHRDDLAWLMRMGLLLMTSVSEGAYPENERESRLDKAEDMFRRGMASDETGVFAMECRDKISEIELLRKKTD